MIRRTYPERRLLEKTTILADPEACWQWQGCTNGTGYGQISLDAKMRYAHRLAYELMVGPIPEGLVIDHLCRNKGCVNPDHLEAVTTEVNNARRVYTGRYASPRKPRGG